MRWIPLELLPQLESLLSREIHTGSRTRRRDALGIALGLQGMRIGEVCRARRCELGVDSRRLFVPRFKRGNAREIDLHDSLIRSLIDWRGDSRNDLLLFTATGRRIHPTHLRRAWRRLAVQLLEEAIKFHGLRHTFAMRLYKESNSDLSLVQQKLGHRSIKSTEVYARSLAEIPEVCLIRVDDGTERGRQIPPLRIYCPAG